MEVSLYSFSVEVDNLSLLMTYTEYHFEKASYFSTPVDVLTKKLSQSDTIVIGNNIIGPLSIEEKHDFAKILFTLNKMELRHITFSQLDSGYMTDFLADPLEEEQ